MPFMSLSCGVFVSDYNFLWYNVYDHEKHATQCQCTSSEYAIRNRDKINQVVIVCACWMIFCLSSAIFIAHQIKVVNELNIQAEEDMEDLEWAWNWVLIYTCGITPFVAIGLNSFQWFLHYRWVTKGGKVTEKLTKGVPKVLDREDFSTDAEAGRYVAMA